MSLCKSGRVGVTAQLPNASAGAHSLDELRRAKASILKADTVDALQQLMGKMNRALLRSDVGFLLLLATRVRQLVDSEFLTLAGHDAAQTIEFLEGAALYCLDEAKCSSGPGTLNTVCEILTRELTTLPLPSAKALLNCLKAHETACGWPVAAVQTLRHAFEATEASALQRHAKFCNAEYLPSMVPFLDSRRIGVLRDMDQALKDGSGAQHFVWVSQGFGETSTGRPLVSQGFRECTGIVMKNLSTGEYLLMHLDGATDAADAWQGDAALHVKCPDYQRFMDTAGDIVVLPILGADTFNRDGIVNKIKRDGATVLPALRVESASSGCGYISTWGLVVLPERNELIVELPGNETPAVLVFSDIFATAN